MYPQYNNIRIIKMLKKKKENKVQMGSQIQF
jgi:hypothetical protein